jgi:hypothetical protein
MASIDKIMQPLRRFASVSSTLSPEERRARHEKNVEAKLTTPLEAEGDALKLKEITKRFPFADFHVTDIEKGLYYKVAYHESSLGWFQQMLWYKNHFSWFEEPDNGTPFAYFPRHCKIEITMWSGVKKDITYLF